MKPVHRRKPNCCYVVVRTAGDDDVEVVAVMSSLEGAKALKPGWRWVEEGCSHPKVAWSEGPERDYLDYNMFEVWEMEIDAGAKDVESLEVE